MIRIMRTRTLHFLYGELSREKERADTAEAAARDARDKACAALARAEEDMREAGARYERIVNDAAAELRVFRAAAADPEGGDSFKGRLALNVIRRHIDDVKASGDEAAIERIRILDWLTSTDDTEPSEATS